MPFASTIALAGLVLAQTGLDGLWYRIDSQSDDPKEQIAAAARGFVEKTSRGRATAADVDPEFMKRLHKVLDTYVQYAEELYIEESAKELVIDDGDERFRIYYLDGEKHERQMADGTRLETTATRVGTQIDVYQKSSEGAEIYETYNLASGGRRLILTVRLEDDQLKEPLVIRNVYERAE